ncbi:MAG: hypothetical protein N0A24_09485 [Armatimonadetes bacterium]|nr:hypothetical protein [Armatimonadota bacterium]MDW8154415.1 hypothetical protein [Armatimonadota bacterium]
MGIYYWCDEVPIKPEDVEEAESLIARHGLVGCVRVWRGEEQAAVIISADSYGWSTCERIDGLLHDLAARGLLAEEVVFVPYQFDTSRGYTILRNGTGLIGSVDTGALILEAPYLPPGEHQITVRVFADGKGRAIFLPSEH